MNNIAKKTKKNNKIKKDKQFNKVDIQHSDNTVVNIKNNHKTSTENIPGYENSFNYYTMYAMIICIIVKGCFGMLLNVESMQGYL